MRLQRNVTCGELRAKDIDREVILAGWVRNRRDHGGVHFVDLCDRYGITQVRFDPGQEAILEGLKSEYVIALRGKVEARPEGQINADRPTGEVEVKVLEVEVLNTSKTPPFEVQEEIEAKEDTRLKYRFVDLRRRPLAEAMVFRSRVTQIIREVFHDEDFVDIETPLLTKTTPEGARDFIVPSRLQPGMVYALPQSPQLFKQVLMVSGLDRYYQICKCLRDEDLRADRQPEFTQLDMEMSFVRPDDVFAVVEKTLQRLWKELKGVDLPLPFPRMSYAEAMARFGIDKPDTRFGLELVDMSDLAATTGFKVFSGAVASGGSVRAIRVPGGASMPRKKVDALEKVAKEYGARGLAWVKWNEDGFQGPVGKFLQESELHPMLERAGAEPGDLLVFVADRDAVVFAALAHVRLHLGRTLDLIDESRTDCLWVVDFPLFEYDEEAGHWSAMHHMFTMPKEPLPAKGEEGDLSGVLGDLYDLVVNGVEMGSGSIRIHRPEVQRRVFELVNLSEDDVEAKFGWFLRALEYGAPPHGGIALGLDRLVMVMLGRDNLREVIAFPKNSRGVCPLTESPSEPLGDALDVLGLRFVGVASDDAPQDA
ncbi:MAG TPA: aspartate--tRNA ligase [Planctomycetes bacterium]|nr:aspartate--tRNA ligase [Planctomycetota bacterium]